MRPSHPLSAEQFLTLSQFLGQIVPLLTTELLDIKILSLSACQSFYEQRIHIFSVYLD